jgi:demethylmenaquinone methyltransferase/2-methoxy-6-polyprenyl-1,4-benzoquinol methylase
MVLEMTSPRSRLLGGVYNAYLNRLLPILARAFSPNPAAYSYLADSIMNFPSPEDFAGFMNGAGLKKVTKFPLTLGITHLYVGIKLP